MAEYEYKTEDQFNVGFGETFEMSVKAPAIAKRIFDTYEHMEMFLNNKRDTAVAGLILSVFKDKTFTYKLIDSNVDEETKERLIGMAEYGLMDSIPTKNIDQLPNDIIIINEDKKTYSTFKKVSGGKNGVYQVTEDPTKPNGLGLKKIGGDVLGDGLEHDNTGKPKIKIESSILSTTDQDGKLIQDEMLTVSDKGLRFNIITNMGVMANNIFEQDPSLQEFKDSLQLFRTDCRNPFKPNMGKTALETAKWTLNGMFEDNTKPGINQYTAVIPQTPYSFKDGEPIAVYYEEENGIVQLAIAIVYVNFENRTKPVSLSWFSNDNEKQEVTPYEAGEGIKLDNSTNSFSTDSSIIKLGEMADDPKLKGDITVTNPIGNFNMKDKVTIDMALKEIIQKILTKVEDVETTLPTTSFEIYADNGNIYKDPVYEVGTPIKGNLKYHYPPQDQGKFTGWWLNSEGFIFAECPKDEKSLYRFSDNLIPETKAANQNVPYDFGFEGIKEGTSTIELLLNYKDSPKNNMITKNDGSSSSPDKRIVKGIAKATRKYFGQYKYFIGTHKQVLEGEEIIKTSDQILDLANTPNGTTGFCKVDGVTTIYKFGSTNDSPTIVLAIPTKYDHITKTCNNFGQEIDLNTETPWVKQKNTITYKHNNISTEYTIYIQYLTQGTIYQNIKFETKK